MSRRPFRIVVLISGSGTNLQAILDELHAPADSGVECVLVVSSSADAPGLERARAAGVSTQVVAMADHPDRESRDDALADAVAAAKPDLVVLAGFMSILTANFLGRFPDRVINLHPSLLPAFPGVDAIGQALTWGVRVTGVTVHFAEVEVDAGPPVLQEAVPVRYGDDEVSLTARIREVEHRLLPAAIRLFADGAVRRDPGDRRQVGIGSEGGLR
ncbi:MAG: phosphoribosylglycinamide formyltransferase [Thermoleophilia bacterium]|nr:phosphoribosylglycinamide formyltransferase [Thermoleophilia bacterium]MDH3725831.1 phosphoribosylglycinamide formyltransferase [Thermoleophilia bacterium]